MSSHFTKYRKTLRLLRAHVPTHLPVRVRLSHVRQKKMIGWVTESRDKRHLNLTVCTRYASGRRVSPEDLAETAVHEWAHAAAYRRKGAAWWKHGRAWSDAYGRSYRATVGEQ